MAMLAQLWLPIVLSAVGVFVASSLIHMLFKGTTAITASCRTTPCAPRSTRANPRPACTPAPHALDAAECKSEDMQKRFAEGRSAS